MQFLLKRLWGQVLFNVPQSLLSKVGPEPRGDDRHRLSSSYFAAVTMVSTSTLGRQSGVRELGLPIRLNEIRTGLTSANCLAVHSQETSVREA